MLSKYHADKVSLVAAQLAAERPQGWSNPLVCDLKDAADFLLGVAAEADEGPHSAKLSIVHSKEES